VVLCLHASPGDHRYFDRLVHLAPDDVCVGVVDLPDHGAAADEVSLGLEPFERDVMDAIASLPTGAPLTLVGHSFGAFLISRLLARSPSRIARAVLLGGFATLPVGVAQSRLELARQIESGALGRQAAESLAVDLFLGGEGTPEDEELIRSMIRDSWPVRLARSCRRIGGSTTIEMPRFETPTVAIHARGDQAIPYELAVDLTAYGNVRLLALDGRSHCPQITNAREVADVLFGDRA
jgi:pimeloyl-ACP methyl ester carboxylesterase